MKTWGRTGYLNSLKVSPYKILIQYKEKNSNSTVLKPGRCCLDHLINISIISKGTNGPQVPPDRKHRGGHKTTWVTGLNFSKVSRLWMRRTEELLPIKGDQGDGATKCRVCYRRKYTSPLTTSSCTSLARGQYYIQRNAQILGVLYIIFDKCIYLCYPSSLKKIHSGHKPWYLWMQPRLEMGFCRCN